MIYFPKNIQHLRTSRGWTQEDLSKRLGYKSLTTVAKWEAGATEPPIKVLKDLASIFHVEVADLIETDLSIEDTFDSNAQQCVSHESTIKRDRQSTRDEFIELLLLICKLTAEQVSDVINYVQFVLRK